MGCVGQLVYGVVLVAVAGAFFLPGMPGEVVDQGLGSGAARAVSQRGEQVGRTPRRRRARQRTRRAW